MGYAKQRHPQHSGGRPRRLRQNDADRSTAVHERRLRSVWAVSRTAPPPATLTPRRIRRKASLNSSVVPVEYEGIKYNLIDAPGLFDFETGAAEGIMAAESVLICVSGRSGVTVGAEKAYQLALKNNKARMIFVTKADLENADYFKILEQMKIKFGPSVCPASCPSVWTTAPSPTSTCSARRPSNTKAAKQVRSTCPTSATALRA